MLSAQRRRAPSRPGARVRHRARALLLLAVALLAAVAAAAMGYGSALEAAGRLLVVADEPAPADAIIVLGGDWKGRIQKGIELYRLGYAPTMVVTGGLLVAPDRTQADYLAEVALQAGVPEEALVRERRSESTWQDATLTVEEAVRRGWRRVIVVTSDWHSRRAARVFRRVYGARGIEVLSVPSPEWRFQLARWWRYPDGGEMVVLEWVRLVWYWLRF